MVELSNRQIEWIAEDVISRLKKLQIEVIFSGGYQKNDEDCQATPFITLIWNGVLEQAMTHMDIYEETFELIFLEDGQWKYQILKDRSQEYSYYCVDFEALADYLNGNF